MNKLTSFIFVFALLAMASLTSKSYAASSVWESWNFSLCDSTTTLISDGPVSVKAIFVSTDSTPGAAWGILVDTPSASNRTIVYPDSYTTAQKKSIQFVFSTTGTAVNADYFGMTKVVDYGDNGVLCSSAATIVKSHAGSGGARQVGVLWRK